MCNHAMATSNDIQVLSVYLGGHKEHGDPRFHYYLLVRSQEGQRTVRMTVELILRMTTFKLENRSPWMSFGKVHIP